MSHLNPLILDVRTPTEYTTGFLPHAISIPHDLIASSPLLLSMTPEARKETRVMLYCRSGRRSRIAEEVLRGMGFERVRDLGGLEGARGVLGEKRREGKGDGEERREGPRVEIGYGE
ncbi:hypothetical protein K402DRAFT_398191 [Aulographum hederae CBS 113979]|uniref:Rhodanese domain-containing protein n=1 Tax=Aulographum hederae CBS 113979 TaxID=1176131 RepID=A0A6G1GLF7_9PEZI|nr:hypothetical protein K402DRAFT_398191 [Aulographum hederae CBS 113979]